MPIIKTSGITKTFGTTVAVDNLSLTVEEGEIYGFLGLNGAGKTTLIRTLLGMIRPDKGEVFLYGTDLKHFHDWNTIGYLVETPRAYPNLSVYENLEVFYKLRKLPDRNAIDTIIDQLKLNKYSDIKAGHLSLGNQQRLGLAKALMHRPLLLILDEPVNGLDPEGIVEVRELLRSLARDGSTIFLSSHLLAEVSKVASRIGIIHNGQLIDELTTTELTEQLDRALLVKTNNNTAGLQAILGAGFAASNSEHEIAIRDKRAISHPEAISTLLVSKGLPPSQVYLYTQDLESYFLQKIQGGIS